MKSRRDKMRLNLTLAATLVAMLMVTVAASNDETCPCLNGGTCIKDSTKCRCTRTWRGDRCEISICGSCQNGGTCRKNGICKCSPGFVGKQCEMKCPCQNGGRCLWKPRLRCRCPSGTFGNTCEFVNPCLNGGRCESATCVGVREHLGLGFSKCSQFKFHCNCKTEWTGDRCQTSACGCENGGTCSGKRCICPRGFTGEKCQIKYSCCYLYGDPHLLTFDGARMDWQGDCRYNVMSYCPCVKRPDGVPSFSVHTKNTRRGQTTRRVSWVRTVEVYIDGARVTLDLKRKVRVNGVTVTLPKHVKNSAIIDDGSNVRLETKFGASVSYDGRSRVAICVPESWKGKTCGICGNNDGDRVNDYVTRDGDRQEHIRWYKRRAPGVASSWRVMDMPGETCSEEPLYHDPPESDTWRNLALSPTYCGMLAQKQFSKCKAALGNTKIEEFMEACRFDVETMAPDDSKVKESLCMNLNTVAGACAEVSQPADLSWRNITGCKFECPAGMTYKEQTSPCVPTCADPDAPSSCVVPESEGCACPEGTLLSGGKCVAPTACGCTSESGDYYEIQETFFSENCSQRFRCQPGNAEKASYIETLPGCAADEMCWAENGQNVCKKQPVNGDWSTWSKWSTCGPLEGHEGSVQMRTRACNNPAPQNGGVCIGKSMEVQRCLPGDM